MASAMKTEIKSETAVTLPPVVNGERGVIVSMSVLERKTNPPKYYTEGALIEDMANCSKYVDDPKYRKTLKAVSGLGTAATRAAILEDLKKHGLLSADKGRLISTEKGRALISFLPTELYDIARTAVWEAELDLIAGGQGGRLSFETELLTEVTEHVTRLRVSPAMPGLVAQTATPAASKGSASKAAGTSKRVAASTSTSQPRSGAPTEKQLEYAHKLAAQLKVVLPPEVLQDFEACRAFIDKHVVSQPPSERAMSFAESIAKRKSVAIPDKVKKSSKELSAWIDSNK
jgi:DNA topoisomerase III